MRSIDKNLNILKLNLLAENRYIQDKLGLTENLELQKGDEIIWSGEPELITPRFTVTRGDRGTYVGKETSGEDVVSFGPVRFYASSGNFEPIKKNRF